MQTLELIKQERVNLSARLVEKSAYYTKVADDINSKLQQQQDWVNTHRISGEMGEHGLVLLAKFVFLSLMCKQH
ncbi:hypothetical protein OIU76_016243 [Salix suchowensis]|uniref:TROPOMYOSIN n=2 Tax=Salix TaxID=40685 RepID=A0A9Q0WAI3_SALPP|nr:hypothetical protein OIU77_004523 [Salix suchowensis]KAJ6379559.1 hypothetical protein OIU76_016243 [Salix suchowensis]KAJ6763624.1 TROPOMYOSIN [Salix purpurea]